MYYQTRYDKLDEAVKSLCEASGLGVAVSLDSERKKLVFEVLQGADRSADNGVRPPMVFNKEYDNVTNREYISDMSEYKNCAITAGQGDGADRKIVIVGGEYSGMERYEVFVDARDIEDDTQLPDRGKSKLAEYACADSYSSDVDGSTYQKKWNLGDIVVTIDREYGVFINERVVEVTEAFDASGYVVTPTFGTSRKTILEKVNDVGKNEPLVEGIKGGKGDPGARGYSVEYQWNGTSLGVKREDETSFAYTDLQGKPGPPGPPGDGGTKIYVQANAPTGVDLGTIWIDT